MSVTVARAVVAGLRAYGVAVHESDGCYSRGNGQTSHYQGGVFHHTGSNFGRDYPTLYNGRPDLPGPLCNTSGNDDGSITLIAAHPANHAGASGGWDTAPLPSTTLFNKEVWGHEIVYPGTVPMRDAQWRSATVLGRVLCDVLGKSEDYIKFHNGTSITGKWDPGYALGKTYPIADFRRDVRAVSIPAPIPSVGSDGEEMLILNANNTWPPSGPGPYRAHRTGWLSGPLFSQVANVAANAEVMQQGIDRNQFSVTWVDNETWDNLHIQSCQARGVELDGLTRLPAPTPAASGRSASA